MLHKITNPIGAQKKVQQLQMELYRDLRIVWGLTLDDDKEYESYGLVYRNRREEGYVPQWMLTGTNEYVDTLLDDSRKVVSFFGKEDSTKLDETSHNTTGIHLVMFVNTNISKLRHRADYNIREDVKRLIRTKRFGFTLQEEIAGNVDSVLAEYPGARVGDYASKFDMHPYHCFRFNFQLTYQTTT